MILTQYITLLLVVFMLSSCQCAHMCYKGSSLYQGVTPFGQVVDCELEDKSYNGTWYCASISVCERNIHKDRDCIKSRGCAKEEQCTQSNNDLYENTVLHLNGTTQLVAGFKMTTSCCKSFNQADDDSTAVNYEEICNSGFLSGAINYFVGTVALSVVTILLLAFPSI